MTKEIIEVRCNVSKAKILCKTCPHKMAHIPKNRCNIMTDCCGEKVRCEKIY